MTGIDLNNRSVRFDPELDLENIAELPGKEIMQDIVRRFGAVAKCTPLIQDSHGWCFHVHSEDGRKYLVELGYAATEGEASRWALFCCRSVGWRVWEVFGSQAPNLGDERSLLEKIEALLVTNHGFERIED